MEKKLAVLLALLTILPLFAACGNNGNKGDTLPPSADVTQPTETTEAVTEDPLADNLPDSDFEGREFRIYAQKTSSVDELSHVYVDEMNGDVINDAVYTAVQTVEDRFSVDITGTGYQTTNNTSNNSIGNSILAGDDFCDILSGHDRTMAQFSLAGMLTDVNIVPHLDYSKPWWPNRSLKTLTIGGVMYLISNSLSYSNIRETNATYFNKARLDAYGIEYPYQTVFDGDWTLDAMTALCKDVYEDVNGDGKRDNDDFYGHVGFSAAYRFIESFDIQPYKADPDKLIVLGMNNERTLQLIDKYYALCFETAGGLMISSEETCRQMFAEDKAMFIFGTLGFAVEYFRYSDVDYGFLPMPKLNEYQEEYCSGSNDKPFGIPVTNTDLDFTGIVMEALNAEGYRTVQPAYFEIAMKQKFTSDAESIEILDIISQSRVLDFGYLYCGDLPLCRFITYLFNPSNPSKDFASLYAKNVEKEQANVDAIIAAYLANAKN